MPQYKLTYFNARGRAELIRWILKISEVEFEDFRIPKGGWAPLKPATPFGQVPTLEMDGDLYCQSVPLCRYLANKYDLGGVTLLDQARADMIVDCCDDVGVPASVIFQTTDAEKKEQLKRTFIEDQLPTFMKYFDNILRQNRGGEKWFVGDQMTWADLAFVLYMTSWIDAIGVTPVWEDYPLLASLKDKVEALPQLVDWFSRRPKTSF